MSQAPLSNNGIDRDDEIDLFELIKSLWAEKILIMLVIIVAATAATGYAFLSRPIYQAKLSLLPPKLSDITGFNLGRNKVALTEFKAKDIYEIFTRDLTSEALRRNFFREVYLPSLSENKQLAAQDKLWEDFSRVLTAKAPDIKRPDYFEVSVEYEDPNLAADWANAFVQRVADNTLRVVQRNALSEIDARAQSIQRRIDELRSTAVNERQDRIARLQEALKIALAVGKRAPEVTAGRTSSGGEFTGFVDGSLAYMRGVDAIRAELEVLQARQSDDPFIAELRGLQSQLAFLKSIDIKPDNVAVVTVDSTAEIPETPIKPKKALIVALGVVLGGLLGVFIALVRSMLLRRREEARA